MKFKKYLPVLLCLIGAVMLWSCSGDENLSPDISQSIVGCWQIGDGDINGDGQQVLDVLANMQFTNITVADLEGYWCMDEETWSTTSTVEGVYFDAKGAVSYVVKNYGWQWATDQLNYAVGQVVQSSGTLSFSYDGFDYKVVGVSTDKFIATADGESIVSFSRADMPQVLTNVLSIIHTEVPAALLGTWERTHVVYKDNDQVILSVDVTPENGYYCRWQIDSDHVIKETTSATSQDVRTKYFSLEGQQLEVAENVNELLPPNIDRDTYQIEYTDTEMTLTTVNEYGYANIYTYKKVQ